MVFTSVEKLLTDIQTKAAIILRLRERVVLMLILVCAGELVRGTLLWYVLRETVSRRQAQFCTEMRHSVTVALVLPSTWPK